jgi:hypothetical protein
MDYTVRMGQKNYIKKKLICFFFKAIFGVKQPVLVEELFVGAFWAFNFEISVKL